MVSESHAFDRALQMVGEPSNRRLSASADYQNMVGPFGGITAAQILQSVLIHPDSEGAPVALTVNYLGPIQDSEFELRPRLVRKNRSNSHWIVELWQDEQMQCSATCVLAKRKPTWQCEELSCPDVPSFESVNSVSAPPGLLKWIDQYDLRFIGTDPFTSMQKEGEADTSESLLWASDRPQRQLDFASLTALADVFFPRVFIRRNKMVPAGTVSLSIYFHVTQEELSALDNAHVLGQARSSRMSNGYADQRAELWSPDRQLLVTTSQMVYYKD